jgi:hypothetical protein
MAGVVIRVTAFQPFNSRVEVDTVLGLHFRYDPGVVALLKQALRDVARLRRERNLGGWGVGQGGGANAVSWVGQSGANGQG